MSARYSAISTVSFILIIIAPFHLCGQDNDNLCEKGYDTQLNGVKFDKLELKNLDSLLGLDYFKLNPNNSNKSPKIVTSFEAQYFVYKNAYLMIASLEGSGLQYFEVGRPNKDILKRSHIKLNSKRFFQTENKIFIGLSESDFFQILRFQGNGFNLIRRFENYSVYYYSCGYSYEYPTGYYQQGAYMIDRPNYIARYVFYKGKLVKFGFGRLPFHPTHEFEDIL